MARKSLAPGLLLAYTLMMSALTPPADATRGPCIPGQEEPTCEIWMAKVFTVADGDTLNAQIRERGRWSKRRDIRLLGVQAMELTDYSRAHGRKGDCHAVAAAERLEDLLQGPKTERRIVRLAAFSKSSKTAGGRARLRRGVAYKKGGRWHDAATTMIREGHGLWDPNRKEWAWNNLISTLAAEAARKGIGIWDTDACGAGPSQEVAFATKVKWDADGRDNQNVNGEWVRITNTHPTSAVSLDGWWLRDAYLRRYDFPSKFEFPRGAALPPGGSLRVHVGQGSDTPTDLFWGEPDPIFENVESGPRGVGDGAYLFDPQGDLRAYAQYPCRLSCDDPAQGRVAIDAHPEAPESITVTNTSGQPLDLSWYEIESVPYFYEFRAGTVLRPSQSIAVVVMQSPALDNPFTLGWGMTAYLLGDKSDAVSLRNPLGAPIACDAWGSGPRALCPDV